VIPGEAEALRIHREHQSSPAIVEHCRTVAQVAKVLARELAENGARVDERVVQAGALLHDIGRTKVQTVWHGYEGAEMLRKDGVDESVAEAVKRHVGAGISAEEARKLGLPDGDYTPRTIEERVVCFADKMVDGNRTRPFVEEVKRFARKGLDVDRLQRLKRDLESELGRDPEEIVLKKVKA